MVHIRCGGSLSWGIPLSSRDAELIDGLAVPILFEVVFPRLEPRLVEVRRRRGSGEAGDRHPETEESE